MSNPRAKAEQSKAKDARQSPAPDKVVSKDKKPKNKKPYIVMYKYKTGIFSKEWMLFGKYSSIKVAESVIEKEKHKDKSSLFSEREFELVNNSYK